MSNWLLGKPAYPRIPKINRRHGQKNQVPEKPLGPAVRVSNCRTVSLLQTQIYVRTRRLFADGPPASTRCSQCFPRFCNWQHLSFEADSCSQTSHVVQLSRRLTSDSVAPGCNADPILESKLRFARPYARLQSSALPGNRTRLASLQGRIPLVSSPHRSRR